MAWLCTLTAVGAVWMDLTWAKVKNEWIVVCALLGGTAQWIGSGWRGIGSGLAGAGVALLLLGWLFRFRMLGAGDIKLAAVLGICFGPSGILRCLWYALLLGAAYSLVVLVREGIWRDRLARLYFYAQTQLVSDDPEPYRQDGVEKPWNFHFTIPVWGGVMLTLLFR